VSNPVALQYVALQYRRFENKGAVRAFTLRWSAGKSSEYFVIIATAAFVAHRARYQNGPGICSLRLHQEFDHSPSTRFSVTDAELAKLLIAHAPKPTAGVSAHKEDQEFLKLRASFHSNKFRRILGATD
jgi:hypothetical protein